MLNFLQLKLEKLVRFLIQLDQQKLVGVQVRLNYKSSDNAIATVDNSGIVTGKAPGIATITATDKITGLEDTFDITITE